MFLFNTVIVLILIIPLVFGIGINMGSKKELKELQKEKESKASAHNFNKMKQARNTRIRFGSLIEHNSLQLITGEVILVESEIYGDKMFSIWNVEYNITETVDLVSVEDKYTLEELKEYDWIIKELYNKAQELDKEISKVYSNKYIKRKDGLHG